MQSSSIEHVENEKVDVIKIFSNKDNTAIELLEPSSNDSVVSKFLNRKGPGIHHISLTVDSIENAISFLKRKDISLVYDLPQKGSDNTLITFIHPESTPGLLIELCQKA